MLSSHQIPLLIDVLFGQLSIDGAAEKLKYSHHDIKNIASSMVGGHRICPAKDFLYYKDHQSVYRAINQNGATTGENKSLAFLGRTDREINPCYADSYQALDQQVITEQRIIHCNEMVTYPDIGLVDTRAIIFPIFNFNGECEGVFIKANLEYSLQKQSLSTVFKILHGGYLKYMVPQRMTFQVNGEALILSARQIELLSYVCFGFSSKKIAQLMCNSPRTVEKNIARLKTIFSVSSMGALQCVLTENNFFNFNHC